MLLCLLLAACQMTGSAATKSVTTSGATFCEVAKVISWSSKDTRETQDQITEHNAVGKELCRWGKTD